MKTTTKKKPAAKAPAKKSATAPAARVPEVVIRIYPHVLHVVVDGDEQPQWRTLDPHPDHVKTRIQILAKHYNLPGPDAVKVEHRDSLDKLVS